MSGYATHSQQRSQYTPPRIHITAGFDFISRVFGLVTGPPQSTTGRIPTTTSTTTPVAPLHNCNPQCHLKAKRKVTRHKMRHNSIKYYIQRSCTAKWQGQHAAVYLNVPSGLITREYRRPPYTSHTHKCRNWWMDCHMIFKLGEMSPHLCTYVKG